MAFKPFRKVRIPPAATLDDVIKAINQIQDNVAEALGQVLGKDVLDTSYVQNINLTVGLNRVAHKLGRTVQGYWITNTHGNYPVFYTVNDNNPSPQLLINLQSSTACTVDIIFF